MSFRLGAKGEKMRNYKNIKAYQLADALVIEIYKATKQFPKEELYGLVSQLRRAAVSIPTNIAEGASRQHEKDYVHFLYIARGSSAEVEYLLDLALKLGYLDNGHHAKIHPMAEEVAKMLVGLIRAIKADSQ
jgi:four helix bundle protein